MNAHSQSDDPALAPVMQFNTDEREFQAAEERFVAQIIDTVLAQQDP